MEAVQTFSAVSLTPAVSPTERALSRLLRSFSVFHWLPPFHHRKERAFSFCRLDQHHLNSREQCLVASGMDAACEQCICSSQSLFESRLGPCSVCWDRLVCAWAVECALAVMPLDHGGGRSSFPQQCVLRKGAHLTTIGVTHIHATVRAAFMNLFTTYLLKKSCLFLHQVQFCLRLASGLAF